MAKITVKEVIAEAKALPPEDQQQLVELLERLEQLQIRTKKIISLWKKMQTLKPDELQSARRLLEIELLVLLPSERESLARSIRGKYAHIRTSSERFAQLKQEEIKMEDRHR